MLQATARPAWSAIGDKAPAEFLIAASVPMINTTVTLTNARKSSFGNTPIGVAGQISLVTGFGDLDCA